MDDEYNNKLHSQLQQQNANLLKALEYRNIQQGIFIKRFIRINY